jgi:SAM-dependent methyltransferase
MKAFFDRIRVRFYRLGRYFLRILGGLESRDSEYKFVYRHVLGDNLTILDVGACKSILPLLWAKRGNKITVIDLQAYPERHQNLSVIQGNFLTYNFPNNAFDIVVMLSSIEHMGLGYYGAPECEDGDFKAMSEVKRILKPGGKIVITFPFIGEKPRGPHFKGFYDLSRTRRLFEGMSILKEEYYIPVVMIFGKVLKVVPVNIDQVTTTNYRSKKAQYSCTACYVISPEPRPDC